MQLPLKSLKPIHLLLPVVLVSSFLAQIIFFQVLRHALALFL